MLKKIPSYLSSCCRKAHRSSQFIYYHHLIQSFVILLSSKEPIQVQSCQNILNRVTLASAGTQKQQGLLDAVLHWTINHLLNYLCRMLKSIVLPYSDFTWFLKVLNIARACSVILLCSKDVSGTYKYRPAAQTC